MKSVIAAIVVVAAGLVVANMLGTAAAEAPTTGATGPSGVAARTVGVQGVATVPLPQSANATTANGVYRQAMANAIADGQSKAEFLASKVGVTLGAAQSVAEGGGSIECKDGESEYVRYEGEQPDFGRVESRPVFAGAAAPVAPVAPPGLQKKPKRSKHKRKKPKAKSAVVADVTCALSTQVALVYSIG
ncbi:MAG TPA: SIMPL domain-containing protein [Solirubrobacteraceae bacterium]|nr:SIMPL domain-containing protein [Solirubrobacteraceae bacterium]